MNDRKSALRLVDAVLRGATLILFALFLLTSLPRLAGMAVVRIGNAVTHAAATPQEARRQVLGPEVAAAYDRLRLAIPRDGAYLLIEGADPREGSALWVRYELAPRKALLLGPWEGLPDSGTLHRSWPPGVRYAIVAPPRNLPPVLLTKDDLLAARERSHAAP